MSVAGETLPDMNTPRHTSVTRSHKYDYLDGLDFPEHQKPRLSEAGLSDLADDCTRYLGTLPFADGSPRHSLWLVFCCPWGGRFTRAIVPFDDRAEVWCDQVASMLDFPNEPEDIAFVILRRDEIVAWADEEIFGLFRSAALRYDVVPWRFYTTGPNGATCLGTS
jgi:hypothetical protein